MRYPPTLGRSALLGLLLTGCIKQPDAIKAPSAMSTIVVGVLDPQDGGPVTGLPDRVTDRVRQALTNRNLMPEALDPDMFAGAFARRRVTQQRMTWLANEASSPPLVVLIEAEALYYSQIQGRNRWTVTVTATVADPAALAGALSSTFEVPVILQFVHEKEPRAVEEAAPIIERQVNHLLDQYLGGLQPDD